MLYARLRHRIRQFGLLSVVALLATSLNTAASFAQNSQAPDQSAKATQHELLSNRELLTSFGRVAQRLQSEVSMPVPRVQSELLPLLPKNTLFFAAIPNYGDAARQALDIFRQERKDDAVLRDWWSKGEIADNGPKIEDAIEKFYFLHQYLGDEIIISGSLEANEPKFLAIAAIRKPGLNRFLGELIEKSGGTSAAGVRVIDPQELAATRQKEGRSDLLVVVRPDFVFASEDVALLRSFNASLTRGSREFLATPFGARIAGEYQSGLTILAGANLESALSLVPLPVKQESGVQQSGFADVKYLVWEHKRIGGKDVSQSELSFTGPRHGAAAWLAKPGPLKALDFVSPEAFFAFAFKLTSPAVVLDDILEMSKASHGSPFAMLPQAEQALGISVRDDLLGSLDGDIALELDDINPQRASWRATLGVKDVPRLEKTLNTLLTATQTKVDQAEEGGISYNSVHIPSSPAPYNLHYAFLDKFLVLGSSRDTIAQAAKLHRSGASVAKSEKFRATTPPGHTSDASAVWYQNPMAMAALQMRTLTPYLGESLASSFGAVPPAVAYLYGEESSIKSASTNSVMDVGGMLVVAAIAIPNLVKSKSAANEATAVGSLRTIVTAQVAYSSEYPKLGFARSLASLGPDPKGAAAYSAQHAGYIDASLGGPMCSGEVPCIKSGYQFRLSAICRVQRCDAFVAVATPVNPGTGSRSFCATDDGVIRFQPGALLEARLTIADCKKWVVLQ